MLSESCVAYRAIPGPWTWRAGHHNMTVLMPYIPPNVYLLADNLDAALAAGEDLTHSSTTWLGGPGKDSIELARQRAIEREELSRIRSLEEVLVARVLRSRERAEDIGRHDPRFGAVARLYTGGTALLIEAVGELGDTTHRDFETADGAVAYLRSRGMIEIEEPAPQPGTTLHVTEDFLVARRLRLGSLMDLVAMFLDALEVYYDLFGDGPVDDVLPGELPLMAGVALSGPAFDASLGDAAPEAAGEPDTDVDTLHGDDDGMADEELQAPERLVAEADTSEEVTPSASDEHPADDEDEDESARASTEDVLEAEAEAGEAEAGEAQAAEAEDGDAEGDEETALAQLIDSVRAEISARDVAIEVVKLA